MSVIPFSKTHIRNVVVFLSFLALIFSGCTQEEAPKKVSLNKRAPDVSRKTDHIGKKTLRFGFDLRLGPKEDVRIYNPFLKYLEGATGRRIRIKFTEKYEDTVENLGNGVTHLAAIGSLSYVIGREKYGIKCLVSGLNEEGRPNYQAMIFTAPESSIKDLKDLKGKRFAFGARMSTQGHLIPRKMLEDAGIRLEDLSHYVYTGSHINAVRAVLNGEYDAGGIQDNLAKRLAKEGKIKIIKISEYYPSSLICYNTTLDNDVVEAIRSALLAFEPTRKHKDMLVDWDKTEMPMGFTEVNEAEVDKVAALARKYGLITK